MRALAVLAGRAVPGAAREQVRVARRLGELPAVAAAFGAGGMSYSQARAITRVATVEDGADWPELARHTSAAQLERIVRGIRRVQVIEEREADPEQARWLMRTRRHYDRDGNLVITIVTRPEYGPVIEAGLEAKRAELDRERRAECGQPVPVGTPAVPAGTPQGAGSPVRATDGEALLALAQDALAAEQRAHPDIARRRRPQLTPQIDPLSGWARQRDGGAAAAGEPAPGASDPARRGGLLRLRPVGEADLRRHDMGRTSRQVPSPLRELLGTLDGERCRFPGCTRHQRLHAHHVRYWSDGGLTDLANLVLVCGRHHTLIHQHSFRLLLHPDRRLDVHTAAGVPVLHHTAQPWGNAAELAQQGQAQHVSAGTLPPDHGDPRIDLGYVVSVLRQQAS